MERQQKGKATYRGQAGTAKGNNKYRHRRDRPQPFADSNRAAAQKGTGNIRVERQQKGTGDNSDWQQQGQAQKGTGNNKRQATTGDRQ